MSEETETQAGNMAVWDAVCRPPTSALKTIRGGRLQGKSDINPQWRVKAMTEQFGLCGVGWKFTIDRLFTRKGVDGVVFAFAEVSVFTRNPDAKEESFPGDGVYWSAPVPGVGGHKLVEQEKGGLYNNDEAFKMAVTDALGTAMKMLGVAADIYLGNYDGSKYLTPHEADTRAQEAQLRLRLLPDQIGLIEEKLEELKQMDRPVDVARFLKWLTPNGQEPFTTMEFVLQADFVKAVAELDRQRRMTDEQYQALRSKKKGAS